MNNNYDQVASVYDWLSKLVFRNAITQAHEFVVSHIPSDSSILLVGGGTGTVLELIAQVHESGLSIDYVEISANMIELSQKRDVKANRVNFIHQSIEAFETDKIYDVVITAFLFDNFKPNKIESVFLKLDSKLVAKGYWLFVDFTNSQRLKHRLLLKIMYCFFRIFSSVEARQLTDMTINLATNYRIKSYSSFYGKFIQAVVYQKL